ncbi:MAG: hypothetical protein KR126chlam4_00048 [Candidatus Anoxychlamydiales bacterium]|uniref:Nucleoside 2-deoxyribosyltransferase n=1 Tax=marine sediment metagenome TaxID=412755 RepID=A0A0F9I112_9ZZZZ|nr:hypothetical protein [Candidatus Anoxychlamydiales bacterium]HEU64123.1 hypothetical protein [Chlamydiota bacterium]
MKFYIATSLLRAKDHNIVRDALLDLGHTITYDWTTHGNVKCTTIENLKRVSQNELLGVKKADILVVLIPGRHGTHVELGAALASDKKIILLSQEEKYFVPCDDTNAFYHHPNCIHVVSSLSNLNPLFDAINNLHKEEALSNL